MKTKQMARASAQNFEQMRHCENGVKYWLASELAPFLGYAAWAMKACENSRQNPDAHFEQIVKPEFPGRFSYHTSCPLKVSNAGVFLCGVNLQEFVDVVLNLGRLRGDNYPLEDFCMLIRHVGEHCVNRVLAGANLQL